MQSSKSILVADDLFADQDSKKMAKRVSAFATRLSERLAEDIELVHVEDLIAAQEFDPDWAENYLKSQQKCLEERVKSFPSNTHGVLLTGKPIETFERLSKNKQKYQCLIMGSHGYRGVKRLLLGSFTEEMIRRSHIPVIVLGPNVKTKAWSIPKTRPIKVLFASDLGDNSKAAENFIFELHEHTPVQLQIYHCFLESLHPIYQDGMGMQTAYMGFDSTFENSKSTTQGLLRNKQARFEKKNIKVESIFDEKSFSAYEGLLGAVRKHQPDLLAMGTHGRNLLAGAFLGNTTRSLLLESPVPIAVVNSRQS